MRRVVITGIGSVNPLGETAEKSWQKLISGQSGAGPITGFDVSDLPCQIACHIDLADEQGESGFNPDLYVEPKEQKRVDDFIVYAMAASDMALADSGYKAESEEQQYRTGVLIGAGIGGLQGIEAGAFTVRDRGPRRLSPFFYSGRAYQSGGWSSFHQARAERPQSRSCDGVLNRCPCHWRCGAVDYAG